MILVLDCNYLCHRAAYSRGHLTFGVEPTGVLFGFMSDLFTLRDHFATREFVFCFDRPPGKRDDMYPAYKATRRKAKVAQSTEDFWATQKMKIKLDLEKQILSLRKEWLPSIGYGPNILSQKGYEADDCIASFCQSNPKSEITIVSADKDLYQLLKPNVTQYDPRLRRATTVDGFRKRYGIESYNWPLIKAMAGCTSDEITGIKGVGEKTAIKYIQGKTTPAINRKILSQESVNIINTNLKLVKLPLEGCKPFTYNSKGKLDKIALRGLLDKYGIKSLMEYIR